MSTEVQMTVIPPCDLCVAEGVTAVPAAYDGATRMGPWAYMCFRHFEAYGLGIGTGVGQRLIQRDLSDINLIDDYLG